MLYFAYGSNLHHFQMKKRCKDSIYLKKINLTKSEGIAAISWIKKNGLNKI